MTSASNRQQAWKENLENVLIPSYLVEVVELEIEEKIDALLLQGRVQDRLQALQDLEVGLAIARVGCLQLLRWLPEQGDFLRCELRRLSEQVILELIKHLLRALVTDASVQELGDEQLEDLNGAWAEWRASWRGRGAHHVESPDGLDVGELLLL